MRFFTHQDGQVAESFPKVGIVFLLGIVHKVLLELAQKGGRAVLWMGALM